MLVFYASDNEVRDITASEEPHLQPLTGETMALCSANVQTSWAGEEKAIWPKDQRGWTLNFYTIGSINYWRDGESRYNLLQEIGCYAEWEKGCPLLQSDWLDTLPNEFQSGESLSDVD